MTRTSWHTTCITHVVHMNESCTSYIWMSLIHARRTYEWVSFTTSSRATSSRRTYIVHVNESCTSYICTTWLMTHWYIRHDSFIWYMREIVVRRRATCMTHSYVQRDSFIYTDESWVMWCTTCMTHVVHMNESCTSYYVCKCVRKRARERERAPSPTGTSCKTHSYVQRDSFMYTDESWVMWCTTCMTHSYERHDDVVWLIHMYKATHLYIPRASSTQET